MENRWWVSTKSRLNLPEILLRREINGRRRYRKLTFKWSYLLLLIPLGSLTALGVLCLVMFFAARFRLNTSQSGVDEKSALYQEYAANLLPPPGQVMGAATTSASPATVTTPLEIINEQAATVTALEAEITLTKRNLCEAWLLKELAPYEIQKIIAVWNQQSSAKINRMLFTTSTAADLALTPQVDSCLSQITAQPSLIEDRWRTLSQLQADSSQTIYDWLNGETWPIILQALAKDQAAIIKAGSAAELNPRLIVASLIVEQLRLYYSQRALFKQFFEPLKIFANSTQISLGVMSIKPETATLIEQHLRDPSSPYYLGPNYAALLDYNPGENPSSARLERLQSEADGHYWSYLYAALYLKQLLTQWESAGYSINDRPEIISTLYNVGFSQSSPKSNPQVGGSSITINGLTYSFGRLANEFYFSGELMAEFPQL